MKQWLTISATAWLAAGWLGCASSPRPGRPTAQEATRMSEEHRQRARGRTDVTAYVPTTFDKLADGPALVEVQLTETFSGDIEGEGTARVVQAARTDGTTSFVAIERVRGSIGGRQGSFVLQVSGTVAGKQMHSRWSVVPGSGTGALTGLRGDGGFEAELGQHGSIWLDYSFA